MDPVLLRGDVVLDAVLRGGHLAGGTEEGRLPLAVPVPRLAPPRGPPGLHLPLHRRRVRAGGDQPADELQLGGGGDGVLPRPAVPGPAPPPRPGGGLPRPGDQQGEGRHQVGPPQVQPHRPRLLPLLAAQPPARHPPSGVAGESWSASSSFVVSHGSLEPTSSLVQRSSLQATQSEAGDPLQQPSRA